MSRMTLPSLFLAAALLAGCQTDKATVSEVPGPTPSKPITASNDPYFLDPAPGSTPGSTVAAPKPEPAPGTLTLGAPPRSAPLTPPPTTGGNYTVRQGDTLWSIARAHYGDGQKWKTIVAANPGLTPEKMQIGKSIVLP